MTHKISSKARKQDNTAKPKLAQRQDKRRFIEQLDDFMSALNCEFTGSINTTHNRKLACK